MHNSSCAGPRQVARAILGAMRAGRSAELERQLRRGEKMPARPAGSLAAEQAELLAAIAADLRCALGGAATPAESYAVHLRLLRHLAG